MGKTFAITQLSKDMIVIITGATSGLGYEIAKWTAMMGATVILACRNEEKTMKVHKCPLNAYGPTCNVTCIPDDSCDRGHFICDLFTGSRICMEGWTGNRCDARVLPQSLDVDCPPSMCHNGGQCFNGNCCCKHNNTDPSCQIQPTVCAQNICSNGGTCVDNGDKSVCNCGGYFTGERCEHTVEWSSLKLGISTPSKQYTDLNLHSTTSPSIGSHATHTFSPSSFDSNSLASSIASSSITSDFAAESKSIYASSFKSISVSLLNSNIAYPFSSISAFSFTPNHVSSFKSHTASISLESSLYSSSPSSLIVTPISTFISAPISMSKTVLSSQSLDENTRTLSFQSFKQSSLIVAFISSSASPDVSYSIMPSSRSLTSVSFPSKQSISSTTQVSASTFPTSSKSLVSSTPASLSPSEIVVPTLENRTSIQAELLSVVTLSKSEALISIPLKSEMLKSKAMQTGSSTEVETIPNTHLGLKLKTTTEVHETTTQLYSERHSGVNIASAIPKGSTVNLSSSMTLMPTSTMHTPTNPPSIILPGVIQTLPNTQVFIATNSFDASQISTTANQIREKSSFASSYLLSSTMHTNSTSSSLHMSKIRSHNLVSDSSSMSHLSSSSYSISRISHSSAYTGNTSHGSSRQYVSSLSVVSPTSSSALITYSSTDSFLSLPITTYTLTNSFWDYSNTTRIQPTSLHTLVTHPSLNKSNIPLLTSALVGTSIKSTPVSYSKLFTTNSTFKNIIHITHSSSNPINNLHSHYASFTSSRALTHMYSSGQLLHTSEESRSPTISSSANIFNTATKVSVPSSNTSGGAVAFTSGSNSVFNSASRPTPSASTVSAESEYTSNRESKSVTKAGTEMISTPVLNIASIVFPDNSYITSSGTIISARSSNTIKATTTSKHSEMSSTASETSTVPLTFSTSKVSIVETLDTVMKTKDTLSLSLQPSYTSQIMSSSDSGGKMIASSTQQNLVASSGSQTAVSSFLRSSDAVFVKSTSIYASIDIVTDQEGLVESVSHRKFQLPFDWWWIIVIIIGASVFLLLTLLMVLMMLRHRRMDSRSLTTKPENIQNYDREHFSVQPEFTNHVFDYTSDSDDNESITHDIYIVNKE